MKYTSLIIASASGSVGGCVFSTNRYGPFIRRRAIPVSPNSVSQQTVKATFAQLAVRWSTVLDDAARLAWSTWALNTPGFVGTGLNAYIALNAARIRAGFPTIIDTAPIPQILAELTAPTITGTSGAADDFDVNFNNADPWANEVGGGLSVSVSRGMQSSIYFFKGPFQFADAIVGAVVPPASPQTVVSPFPFSITQRIYVRFIAFRADGRISEPIILTSIAGA